MKTFILTLIFCLLPLACFAVEMTQSTEINDYDITSDDATNGYKYSIARTQAGFHWEGTRTWAYIYSPDFSVVTDVGMTFSPRIGGYDWQDASAHTSALDINTTAVMQVSNGTYIGDSGTDLTDGTTKVNVDGVTTCFFRKIVTYVEFDLKTGLTTSATSRVISGQGNEDAQGSVNFTADYYSAIGGTETSRVDVTLTGTNEEYAWTNSLTADIFDMMWIRSKQISHISGSGATDIQRYEHSFANSQDCFWQWLPTSTAISGVFWYASEQIFEDTTAEAAREAYAYDIRAPYSNAITGTLATTANYVTSGYDFRYGWYEIAADTNVVQIEFDDAGGTRSTFTYYNTPIKITGWTDAGAIKVEKSADDAGSWATLTSGVDYVITVEGDEGEVGSNIRIFQLLGTMSGTGGTANHLKFTVSAAPPARRLFLISQNPSPILGGL